MKAFEIGNIEVIDNNSSENLCASGVSVLVTVNIDDGTYCLDFQTTRTYDAGAISSKLFPYEENDLIDAIEDEDEYAELANAIGENAEVDKLWEEYIEENYIRDTDHFGGMDANSERDEMQKRS